MKFSIILPIHNVEKYLAACIDSILSQTFRDFELILVNDGSTDRSPAICDDYAKKDSRIRVIHKINGGVSEARNCGLKAAKGEYIFFIDSDDFLSGETVLSEISAKTHGDVDVVAFKFKEWYESSGTYGDCKFSFAGVGSPERATDDILCQLIDRDAYYNSAWSKVIKREILVNNRIEFEQGLLGEDNDWYYKVIQHINHLVLLDRVFYIYRQRAGSITKTHSLKNLTDLLYIIDKWTSKIGAGGNASIVGNDRVILHSLAKQYCHAIIMYSSMGQKTELDSQLRKFSYLLRYSKNRRVLIFRTMYRLVGIRGILSLLKLIRKIKK